MNSKHQLAQTAQLMLPSIDGVDLVAHADLLYERSLGCVGILKDWLTKTLNSALALDEPRMSVELLEANALPLQSLNAAAEEMAVGEGKLTETEHDRLHLRELLGIGAQTDSLRIGTAPPVVGSAREGRVGTRAPVRDPVGVQP